MPNYLLIYSRFYMLYIHVLQFYNFYTPNTFFGKHLTIQPKMDPYWLHIQQNNAIFLWLYMYTPDDGQPQPKHVVFNIINWLIYWYIQFNRLLHIEESTCCVMA
jgi:hypothetical protein